MWDCGGPLLTVGDCGGPLGTVEELWGTFVGTQKDCPPWMYVFQGVLKAVQVVGFGGTVEDCGRLWWTVGDMYAVTQHNIVYLS